MACIMFCVLDYMYLFVCVLLKDTATFVCGNSGPSVFHLITGCLFVCVSLKGLTIFVWEEFGTCSIILIIVSYDNYYSVWWGGIRDI